MSLILHILILIGSIALFLYGMKTMGEALQKISASRMRYLLRTMSNSAAKQVFVGLAVTAIVQSSGASTVMIVSFVNAGLITLMQAIGMIMGVNIGATTIAWLISIFGFNFNIGMFAIPLMGFGFPLLYGKSSKTRAWGNIIIGFALLFIAITFMRQAVEIIDSNHFIINVFENINSLGFFSLLIYLVFGVVTALFVQSSSAALALTMVLCYYGIMPFEMGAAMVIGENVGTTIVSNMAASGTNINARRAALFHLIFNLFGAIWVLLALRYFVSAISAVMMSVVDVCPVTSTLHTPIGLAMFHSMFNIVNTMLLIGLGKPIAAMLSRLIEDSNDDRYQLQYIDSGAFATGAISMVQAQHSIGDRACKASKMFDKVKVLFRESNQDRFYQIFEEIEVREHNTTISEDDFNMFISNIMRGDIGNDAKEYVRLLSKLASDVDVMSDNIYTMAKIVKRRKDKGAWFTPELRESVNQMFGLVDSALLIMNDNLRAMLKHQKLNIDEALRIEEMINQKRTELKEMPHRNEDGDQANFISWVIFTDIINKSEQLADSILRVSKDACKAVKHNYSSLK